jgi:hypothetical protein
MGLQEVPVALVVVVAVVDRRDDRTGADDDHALDASRPPTASGSPSLRRDVLRPLGQVVLGRQGAGAGEATPLRRVGVREAGPEQLFDRRQARRGQRVHQAVDVLAAGHEAECG